MIPWTRITHRVSNVTHIPKMRSFVNALNHVEIVQRRKLKNYLLLASSTALGKDLKIDASWSWEAYSKKMPLTDYSEWQERIEQARVHRQTGKFLEQPCLRYEPTSGSTSRRKWIPYTRIFLNELTTAASAWLFDLSRQFPQVLNGKHYWSLSWLPDELRKEGACNDEVQVFPWWKQFLLSQVMAAPCAIGQMRSTEESLFATCAYLAACSDLSLISVWSPTFALEILKRISLDRGLLAATLQSGVWPQGPCALSAPRSLRASQLLREWDGTREPQFFAKLWPKLALVSAWDSSSSRSWARDLQFMLPHSSFQGKGVWATEGVITIPFQNCYPLAVQSHFYEFKCLDTGVILPAWKLRESQRVQPILTTGNLLMRYALQDELEVTQPLQGCPTLKFVSRLQSADLVGEKLDASGALQVFKAIEKAIPIRCVSLIACQTPWPGYALLAEGKHEDLTPAAVLLEKQLCEFHHYRLARELGQLQKSKVIFKSNPLHYYETVTGHRGVKGSQKIEPVFVSEGPLA